MCVCVSKTLCVQVEADREEGLALLLKAANTGHILATFDLARVYMATPMANGSSCGFALSRYPLRATF